MGTANICELYIPLVHEKARLCWHLLVPNPNSEGRNMIGSAQFGFCCSFNRVAVGGGESPWESCCNHVVVQFLEKRLPGS